MSGNDLHAINTFENPDNVVPRNVPTANSENGAFNINIDKLSWNVLRFKY